MQSLLDVILPVFLLIGFGYTAVWTRLFSDNAVDGLMRFAQNFAIPALLYRAISTLDLGQSFDLRLLGTFYSSVVLAFIVGILGARILFKRPKKDSIVIGFCCLFSNTLLLGLPISERAFGTDALASNYAIIAFHAPFCYALGITTMEISRNRKGKPLTIVVSILKAMFSNAMVIGIMLGFFVNLTSLPVPGLMTEAIDLMVRAALPSALFALGGVLYRYRPEGDLRTIFFVCAVSLLFQPVVIWIFGTAADLPPEAFRSAVITGAMAPGVNAYVFANMYGVAKRVVASAVLFSTLGTILTAWGWLWLLAV